MRGLIRSVLLIGGVMLVALSTKRTRLESDADTACIEAAIYSTFDGTSFYYLPQLDLQWPIQTGGSVLAYTPNHGLYIYGLEEVPPDLSTMIYAGDARGKRLDPLLPTSAVDHYEFIQFWGLLHDQRHFLFSGRRLHETQWDSVVVDQGLYRGDLLTHEVHLVRDDFEVATTAWPQDALSVSPDGKLALIDHAHDDSHDLIDPMTGTVLDHIMPPVWMEDRARFDWLPDSSGFWVSALSADGQRTLQAVYGFAKRHYQPILHDDYYVWDTIWMPDQQRVLLFSRLDEQHVVWLVDSRTWQTHIISIGYPLGFDGWYSDTVALVSVSAEAGLPSTVGYLDVERQHLTKTSIPASGSSKSWVPQRALMVWSFYDSQSWPDTTMNATSLPSGTTHQLHNAYRGAQVQPAPCGDTYYFGDGVDGGGGVYHLDTDTVTWLGAYGLKWVPFPEFAQHPIRLRTAALASISAGVILSIRRRRRAR